MVEKDEIASRDGPLGQPDRQIQKQRCQTHENAIHSLSPEAQKEQQRLADLIDKIQQHNESAMQTLYDATVNRVFALALRIVQRHDMAEEVVTDVYLHIWKSAEKYSADKASVLSWIMLICRSRSIDRLRREAVRTRGEVSDEQEQESAPSSTPTPLAQLLEKEQIGGVHRALKNLSDSQRQMVALAFYQGLTHQEISAYTHQPLGTVKSQLRRAQIALREYLSEYSASTEVSHG